MLEFVLTYFQFDEDKTIEVLRCSFKFSAKSKKGKLKKKLVLKKTSSSIIHENFHGYIGIYIHKRHRMFETYIDLSHEFYTDLSRGCD